MNIGLCRNFAAVLFLLSGILANAQTSGKVSGKLESEAGEALSFATVGLSRSADSSFVKGELCDEEGRFYFENIPLGAYYVQISYFGLEDHKGKTFEVSAANSSIDLGTIVLKEDAQTLEAVTITGRKPLIEQTQDKLIVNVDKSVLAEGNTALELLEKSPGIVVDENGKISLKGKGGVSVMLNGKLTYLSDDELADLLRGTNSASVEKIEIITNPSSRYDAEGMGGIINIVLKKDNKKGLNGGVNSYIARSRATRYGAGFTMNYQAGKFNAFGSYNHGYRGEVEYVSYTRRFRTNGTVSDPDRVSYMHTTTDEPLYTNNARAGIDYYLNERNILGFVSKANVGTYYNFNTTTNSLQNASGDELMNTRTDNNNRTAWNSLLFNLNYVRKIDDKGRELSADLDFSNNLNRSRQRMDTRYFQDPVLSAEYLAARKGNVPSLTQVYVGKIDYRHPVEKLGELEAGLKSSYVTVDNNLRYDTLANDEWMPDASWSNHFKYDETIHAAYLSLNRKMGKFSFMAGLRGEYTETVGRQITTDSVVKLSYLQLFPSFFLTREINNANSLQVSYSRRVGRPDYDDLNPFRFFRDPYMYFEGNPFLRPELTHSLELSHSFDSKIITTLNYSYTSDVINWMMGQIDSLNLTYQSPQNLMSQINYGVSVVGTFSVTSWWMHNSFINVFRNQYKGDHKGGELNNRIISAHYNTQNTFRFGKGISGELSGFYNSPTVYGVFVNRSYWVMSAGIQKQVLNKKGTVKLAVNDIFQGRRRVNRARYENLDISSNIRFDSRVVTLSFSYRFGGDVKTERERKSAIEDIQDRVN